MKTRPGPNSADADEDHRTSQPIQVDAGAGNKHMENDAENKNLRKEKKKTGKERKRRIMEEGDEDHRASQPSQERDARTRNTNVENDAVDKKKWELQQQEKKASDSCKETPCMDDEVTMRRNGSFFSSC